MLLTEEQQLIQQQVCHLIDKAVRPYAAQWSEQKHFPKDALNALADAGLMGMLIPNAWGGSEISHVDYVIVLSEIAKGDGALSTIVSVHNSVAMLPILHFGTDQQKAQFLQPMAKGKLLGAFCLSEPQAGSDAANITTRATRQDNQYILNGVKQFVTSGSHADIAIVFAKVADKITAFIVPTDTPGFNVARVERKMGQHASDIAQIVLENVVIPAEYQLGDIGQGYKIALSQLACGRLGIAAQCIGMAEEALNLSIQYAKERKTFGKFLYEHQAISFKLADMATQLEAAKQLCFAAALRRDKQLSCIKEAAMAKLFASEVAEKICREAMQIYGGYGYLQDFPLERIYRDVRVASIYEGTSDIQRMIIARELI